MIHSVNDRKVKEILAFLAPTFGFPAIYKEEGFKELCETACQGAYVSTGLFIMRDMLLKPMSFKEQAEWLGYSPEQAYQEWVEFIIIFCATILFYIENYPEDLDEWLKGLANIADLVPKQVRKRINALRHYVFSYKRNSN